MILIHEEMDSLSGNQVKDLKDLYKSIYKVEESTEEAAPSSVEEETITEMPNLPKMGTLFPSQIKKDDNKINFSTNIAGTPINKNQIDKNKNKKMSNIPPEEGSNKKFNPDFGKKPEVNKVDTNKVDTNKNDIVKKGPDLNAISKYTDSNRKEVTMKDFQSSDSGVKPEIKPVKSKMNPIEVKNRARFGDDRVDMLKAKNIDFKAMRKGDMTKDDFIKKYPKSITAQKAAGLRDEYEPYDLVLDYVLSEGHADTVEEAHYVMMQMDEGTIQTIVEQEQGVFKSNVLNKKYDKQPEMTEKGKKILPKLNDPIINGKNYNQTFGISAGSQKALDMLKK